jgi:hypothetical protein
MPVPALVAELYPCLSLLTKLLGEAGNAMGWEANEGGTSGATGRPSSSSGFCGGSSGSCGEAICQEQK